MWPEGYNDEWGKYTRDYLGKQWNTENNLYDQIMEQLKDSKFDQLKTWKEIEQYQQVDNEKHQEEVIKRYIKHQVLSNDIFDDLDEATQAKVRLLLGDVYIIPKDKI